MNKKKKQKSYSNKINVNKGSVYSTYISMVYTTYKCVRHLTKKYKHSQYYVYNHRRCCDHTPDHPFPRHITLEGGTTRVLCDTSIVHPYQYILYTSITQPGRDILQSHLLFTQGRQSQDFVVFDFFPAVPTYRGCPGSFLPP